MGYAETVSSVSLMENILFPVPHWQYVFSLPIFVHQFFRYDRKLLSVFCHSAIRALVFEEPRERGLVTQEFGSLPVK